MADDLIPASVIANAISDAEDKRRMSAGIKAAAMRERDFRGPLEMKLAGMAMVPEARDMLTDRLSGYWDNRAPLSSSEDYSDRECIIGGGFHAAVYAATRVRMGFPKPIIFERGTAGQVGGTFAMSMSPVFRLNSRARPGKAGQPDQDRALNYLPGGLIQPAMVSSEEYPTNADMAWVIRLALAQFAEVIPDVTVMDIESRRVSVRYGSLTERTYRFGRVIDARGVGDPNAASIADGERILTFPQFMARMGGMFPLRGLGQVAVVGGGDSAKCAVESLLGIAPGHTSTIGLDYVNRVDWYARSIGERTCDDFRNGQRGRYIRLGQYLDGNASNPSTRLKIVGDNGYTAKSLDGVLVNERAYDMAILCTGNTLPALGSPFFFPVQLDENTAGGPVIARVSEDIPGYYRVGPAANIDFSGAELSNGVSEIPANKVAMFRLAPRTSALAARLRGL